ncbi:vacuolar protein sorting-associated protein 26c [Anaeramoeba ignava]|uniref:Vacuolar protein sorting-associated protein 26c n=1 Tax=Anaeramoeba ignava TaxID=1746090 RepID=A0A9Q0LT69_ANAIG|nr:vacuolar protein sorting-associated protein 26c [Anaeramoeba ignava]
MSIEIKLKKMNRTYTIGEKIVGVVYVRTKKELSHQGLILIASGDVGLQTTTRTSGLFEAISHSIKPFNVSYCSLTLLQPGKIPSGETELPFEFVLAPKKGEELVETYHGVFINSVYTITATLSRGRFGKKIQGKLEYIAEVPTLKKYKPTIASFTISPQAIENVKKSSIDKIPKFTISGQIDNLICDINSPLTGFLVVQSTEFPLRSIEVQLIRSETCGTKEDGFMKEDTQIQNIEIADGNVCPQMKIPIYMKFPRLFTCPSLSTSNFVIDFEINVVFYFIDGHILSKNFPIKITRN